MNPKVFTIIGWTILLIMGVSWIRFGYSNWYLLLLPLASLSFSIKDGSIKKLEILKRMSVPQYLIILLAFIASVAIVFGLIQVANYFINDVLQLTGMLKTLSIVIAIIFALYPVKFTFGSIFHKVIENLNRSK